ncbi:MAG: leucine-rich repeat domain-containing protein [Trueperaceae bacterium]|nr:MAG: leucine-rich repeat domain-containing protein [Trueperaceae bacterium]
MRTSFLVRQWLVGASVLVALGLLVACGGPGVPTPAACTEPTDLAPIADAALADAVREALGVTAGPTCGELAKLTVLDIQDLGVTTLAGLEHAHALVTLQADRNDVDDVTVLAGLSNLRGLWFGGNQVSDIAALAGLTELRGISFWNNPVTSVAPISAMTQLTHAYIGDTPARDHHLLVGLTQLRVLNLNRSGLTNLDVLAGMTEIEEFHATWNDELVDASALASATKLVRLDLGDTGLTDVAFLSSLPDLRMVTLWGNPIADVGPIEALSDLTHLDVGGTGVNDLAFLANSPGLASLYAWSNEIADISVLASLPDLVTVVIPGNALSDIGALVANAGFAAGAQLNVAWNCLDVTPGSANRNDIDALVDRGVAVEFEPQRDGC